MTKYKTISTIDFTKTVVISFDVKIEKDDYNFGVGYEGGNLLFAGQNSIEENYIPKIDEISSSSIEENYIEFSPSSKFTDEIIIKDNENNNLVYDKDNLVFFENPINNTLYLDDDLLIPLDENKSIFKKIDEISSENVKDLIVENDEIYKIAEEYEVNSYCLSSDINDKENFILKIKDDGFDLELLNLFDTAVRNIKEYPVSQILQTIVSEDIENVSEIYNDTLFKDDQTRIRFVFTNGGRLLNVSRYIKDKKLYENVGSFSFTQNLKNSYIYVYANSSSSISNVSTNF